MRPSTHLAALMMALRAHRDELPAHVRAALSHLESCPTCAAAVFGVTPLDPGALLDKMAADLRADGDGVEVIESDDGAVMVVAVDRESAQALASLFREAPAETKKADSKFDIN